MRRAHLGLVALAFGCGGPHDAVHDAPPAEPAITLSISFDGGELGAPTFDATTGTYSLTVGLWLQRIQVSASPADPNATVTIAGVAVPGGTPSAAIPLALGVTSIPIEVTPSSGPAVELHLDVTRAPMAAVRAALHASNAEPGDGFSTVAIAGDILAIGAPSERSAATGINGDQLDNSLAQAGAVYVFHRNGGVWEQEAYLKPSNTKELDTFGSAVALWGDTLAVGANQEPGGIGGIDVDPTDTSAPGAGAVYVFVRSTDGTWSQQAFIKASNPDSIDNFGDAVALWGDTLAVGAPGEDSAATGIEGNQSDNSASLSGAVYVYARNNGTWSQQAYVKASNTDAGDAFGVSVALWDDTLVVGAVNEGSNASGINGDETNNSLSFSGAAYVFRRVGTTWAQEAYVKASNPGAGDELGASVALWHDTMAVGARSEASSANTINGDQSSNDAPQAGAVYVFTRGTNGWTQEAYIKAFNADARDEFGRSVALFGDTLAVGAMFEDGSAVGVNPPDPAINDNNTVDSGAVYLFSRDSTGWTPTAYVKSLHPAPNDYLGEAGCVGLWGDTLVVGVATEMGTTGAAYVFQ